MKPPEISSHQVGVLWSFTSATLWSTTFVGARILMRDRCLDPLSLSLARFMIGGIILFILGCIFFRRKILSICVKDILRLALLALMGMVGMSLFLFMGQESTTAINSSMIIALTPVLILFIGVFIGEALTLKQIVCIFTSLFGCALVIDVITLDGIQYRGNAIRGDLLVLLSALCWALYSVFSKPIVKRLGGYSATTWAVLLGAFELLIIRFLIPANYYLPTNPTGWGLVIYIAIFPTAIAFFAWYEAMNRIELSLLNIMQYLTPVFTIFISCLLLNETLTILNLFGVLIVLLGVAVTMIKRPLKEPTSSLLIAKQ